MDVGDGDMQEDPRPTRARPDALRGWVFLSMLAPDSTRDGDLCASLEQPILVCREETRRAHQGAMAGVQPTPRHISLDLAPGADCDLHHLAANNHDQATPPWAQHLPVTYTVYALPVCGQEWTLSHTLARTQ